MPLSLTNNKEAPAREPHLTCGPGGTPCEESQRATYRSEREEGGRVTEERGMAMVEDPAGGCVALGLPLVSVWPVGELIVQQALNR